MASLSQTLADYVLTSEIENLPANVRHEGSRALLNWLGCALGGSTADLLQRALAFASRLSGPAEATVLGHAKKLDVASAAFINALSSALHAYDDNHLATIAHPTGPVAAACLAMAQQRRTSGQEYLHALLLGLEVECRLGCMLMEPPGDCSPARTMTGLIGGIGAAAGLAKIVPMTRTELVSAMGIASVMAAGFREGVGSMARDLPMGLASRSGVEAVLLAREGFTSTLTMLDGAKGFAHMFATTPNLAAATRGLGRHFELMSNAYKPYPAGIVIHPVIEACLLLATEQEIEPRDIERVELRVHPDTVTITGLADPTDGLEAQISAAHWAAAALVRRRAGLEEASDQAARDPEIASVRARTKLVSDLAYGRDGTRVLVHLQDGRVLTKQIEHCIGSPSRPMSDRELEEKFHLQARTVVSENTAEKLIQFCWRLEQVNDVGAELNSLLSQ